MNGTSAMTGVGMASIIHAQYLIGCSVVLSAITNELMKSFDDHFSFEIEPRKHSQRPIKNSGGNAPCA
jgi:histidine ammonia-lyase